MNEVIVISGATHRAGVLDEYERQLRAANVPFELEPYPALQSGPDSVTMRLKHNFLKGLASKYSQFTTIYNTDAYDVLFYGTHEELIAKAPSKILFSAERNCYPESAHAYRIHGPGPWKYVNAGTLAANREYLLKWLESIENDGELDILDQRWYNRRLADSRTEVVPLDYDTNIFYVVSGELEDGALKIKDNRPWNESRGTFPNFLHFSGSTSNPDVIHYRLSLIGEMK